MKSTTNQNLLLFGIITLGSIAITAAAQIYHRYFRETKPAPPLSKYHTDEDQDLQYTLPPINLSPRRISVPEDKIKNYGSLKVANRQNDPILFELERMSTLVIDIERINNLIVDLQLQDVKMYPNPIVAHKRKLLRDDPFLSPEALTAPLSFVLHTTEVKAAQIMSQTKKWLRSGPRATIYFHPSSVKAAVVSMGGMVPGVNTVIKELVYTLEEYYGVKHIQGIKYSFETHRKESVDLNVQRVKTLHHYGGSLLGVCRVDISPDEIVERLVNAGINQLYIIGGPGTLKLANQLHETIKRKMLNIGFCVIPKELTNAIPITERSIGFETALEQTQKMVEAGYTESHAHDNGVSIIKVAGKKTGFLAVETALASRNVQACLVPEFSFELHGDKGLLAFIHQKLKERGNCTIVVAQGSNEAILDYDPPIVSYDWDGTPIKEDINILLKKQLKKYLGQRNFKTAVKLIDTYSTRASPANAQDTRICCRYAAQSIHGVMAGYTNFMIGSAMGRTIMIPLGEVNSGHYSDCLVQNSNHWTRLLLTTSQPSFRNDEE